MFGLDEVCEKLRACGAIKTLLALTASECAEVVRETARLLARVGGALGKKVCDSEFCGVLQQLRKCPDVRARAHVAELLDSLRM